MRKRKRTAKRHMSHALPCVVHTGKWIPEFSILHDEVRLRQPLQAAAAAEADLHTAQWRGDGAQPHAVSGVRRRSCSPRSSSATTASPSPPGSPPPSPAGSCSVMAAKKPLSAPSSPKLNASARHLPTTFTTQIGSPAPRHSSHCRHLIPPPRRSPPLQARPAPIPRPPPTTALTTLHPSRPPAPDASHASWPSPNPHSHSSAAHRLTRPRPRPSAAFTPCSHAAGGRPPVAHHRSTTSHHRARPHAHPLYQ